MLLPQMDGITVPQLWWLKTQPWQLNKIPKKKSPARMFCFFGEFWLNQFLHGIFLVWWYSHTYYSYSYKLCYSHSKETWMKHLLLVPWCSASTSLYPHKSTSACNAIPAIPATSSCRICRSVQSADLLTMKLYVGENTVKDTKQAKPHMKKIT